MSHFRSIELKHASRLLNHGPTILITSRDEHTERRNVMAAAWSMPVEFEPPRIAIVVDKTAWSRELIERSGKFGIVIPGVAATNWTYAVGSVSGRVEDKFNCYGIPVVKGPVLGLPLIEAKCLAWMECRLLPATAAQEKYDTLFGKWSRLPLMSELSWKDAGSLMMINSIPCIILAPERLSPAGNA
jgi:flavin reductase (DIM6/NTAB) family NADH-FMN oxidoreductase RutF